ncbi:MAG: ketopantoate reductase family protein [bacterium]
MNILVIGAGAIGSLFGGLLSREARVVLQGPHGAVAIPRPGISVADEESTQDINITTFAEGLPPGEEYDLVIVATKATANRKVALSLRAHLGERTHVLLLQNGMGNEDVFGRAVRREKILRGVVYEGVVRQSQSRIVWWGKGVTYLGYYFYPSQSLEDSYLVDLASLLGASGLKARVAADIRREVWKKLIINAAMNPLGAITGCENRSLVENRDTRELLGHLVREGERAARIEGYSFDLGAKVEDLARRTGRNLNSMLQDFRRGKRSEIEFLNGFLIRYAEAHNEDLPHHRSLTLLVRAIEAQYE